MVNLNKFGGLTSVLKFHCEELVGIRVICEGLVPFFSNVKNWYSIFTNVYVCMNFLVYTLIFCCLHAISNKLLFAQRFEIMSLSDFINSKAKYLRQSHTI